MDHTTSRTGPRRPVVVKIGGSTLGHHDTTLDDLVALARDATPVVVVHGGGRLVTEWLDRLQVPSRFLRGLRVTTPEALDVVIAVLAGLVNKRLTGRLVHLGAPAIGLSGVDAGLVRARVTDPDLGLVGEVESVNAPLLGQLLDLGLMPVIATSALNADPSASSPVVNINGDTATASIAVALEAETLVYLSDVPGVLDSNGISLPRLDAEQANRLLTDGSVSGGMIPKLEGALLALDRVDRVCIVDGREPGALLQALRGAGSGTVFEKRAS